MIPRSHLRTVSTALIVMGQLALAQGANAIASRQSAGSLKSLAFVAEAKHTRLQAESLDDARYSITADISNTWDSFLAVHGEWSAAVDRITGKIEVAEGEGIPFIPGAGNELQMINFAGSSGNQEQIDLETMEAVARAFLPRVASLLGVDPSSLALNRSRSGQPSKYLWFVDFDVVYDGISVEGARVVFRVNNGNLIQFGTENMPSEGTDTPKARISRNQALAILSDYIGGFSAADFFTDDGSQHLLPVLQADRSSNEGFKLHQRRGLVRAWQFTFRRDGEIGTWRARIDAVTGNILELRDINDYAAAQVAGGVVGLEGAEIRPMPFADLSSGGYTNSAGVYDYSGGAVTSTLNGQYVVINDSCGAISLGSDASGNLGFGTSTGTDCVTPGFGGSGNTNASRTQFYYLNRAKEIARGWLDLPWLAVPLTANVNLDLPDDICRTFWDGDSLNLPRSRTGCSNSGEIQGLGLHEYGHGLDENDGNGASPDKGTAETYSDWTTALITRDSCIGAGYRAYNCDGFGDTCTYCTGVRDIDYSKHLSGSPHTVGNFTQNFCPADNSYSGPCGREGHCESHVSSEALWDLAARDLPNPGSNSAWAVMDRLWYLSRPTATAAFSCFTDTSPWTSDGCGIGSLWKSLRAVDDDDGNLANGTPHSAALYAAFDRHDIACPSDAGAATSFRGCTQPPSPIAAAAAGDHNVTVTWSDTAGVYDIYRNDQGCNAGGFMKVANDLTTPPFTDTGVANNFTYSYQIVAQPIDNEACSSAPSSCVEASPCPTPAAPASLGATAVSASQIDLSWSTSSGATRYYIHRATTSGGPYAQIGIQSGNTLSDSRLICGTAYYYVVQAAGNETCRSGNSTQVHATTIGCSLDVSNARSYAGAVTSSPPGIDCGEDCSEPYLQTTQVTLTAIPAPGFAFQGWSGACSGTGACNVLIARPASVAATFSLPDHTLTVSRTGGGTGTVTSSPAGIDCGSACSEAYNNNTVVTLTATPAAGSVFSGWSGECSGLDTCTVPLDQERSVTAIFSLAKYKLTVILAGPGSGKVTSTPTGIDCGIDCSGEYGYDEPVTLTAVPSSNLFTFSGWSGACSGTGSCTVIGDPTMDPERSVTATFEDNGGDFYTVPLCRVLDTRITSLPLTSDTPMIINVAGLCGIPATAKAVSLNVTAITAPGQGTITLYPGDVGFPGTWTISFAPLVNQANNAVIPLAFNGDGTLAALAAISGGGTMDMALDVNGYFE